MGYQRTTIIGNVGRDPEMKYLPDGPAVCNFSVAVNEKWTDKKSGQRKENATWYRVNVWGKSAESAYENITKGATLLVEGMVSASAYIDNDGKPKASLELRASLWLFVGSKSDGSAADDNPSAPPPADTEDIPF